MTKYGNPGLKNHTKYNYSVSGLINSVIDNYELHKVWILEKKNVPGERLQFLILSHEKQFLIVSWSNINLYIMCDASMLIQNTLLIYYSVLAKNSFYCCRGCVMGPFLGNATH